MIRVNRVDATDDARMQQDCRCVVSRDLMAFRDIGLCMGFVRRRTQAVDEKMTCHTQNGHAIILEEGFRKLGEKEDYMWMGERTQQQCIST